MPPRSQLCTILSKHGGASDRFGDYSREFTMHKWTQSIQILKIPQTYYRNFEV